MIWPEPQQDETFYSWLARMARLNAVSNDLAFCDRLTGERSTSIMDAPFNLPVLCEKSEGCLESPATVLRQTTAVHVACALGDIEINIPEEIEAGTRKLDLTAESLGGMCRWRFCPDCMRDNIAESGFAWWRRVHQLPTALVCAIHGLPLRRLDVKRHRVHERFILPTDGDGGLVSELPPAVSENPALWKAVARLGMDALNGPQELPSPSAIRNALLAGLHQQGLTTRGGKLRRDAYVAKFRQRIGHINAPGLLKRLDAEVEPQTLVNSLWTGTQRRQPLIRLLLVHWLFGSWQSYLDRCFWEGVLGAGRLPDGMTGNEHTAPPLNESLIRHRDVCLEFLARHVGASRSTFWREHPGSLRWLKRHDAEWLNFHFPLNAQRGKQLALFD
jgi:hypothetical protein